MTDTLLDVMDEKQMLMDNEIKYPAILILGAQGVGKSTLGNMLLGSYSEQNISPVFPISDRDYDDDEKEDIYRTTEVNIEDDYYNIIDTIGIPESESTDEIWNKLKEVEKKAKDVRVYIFVLEGGRLTQHGLLFIQKLFTRYPIKSRTIVVFTKVRKSLILSKTAMRNTFNTQISTLLQSINDRWLVMPSLDLFGNSEGKSVIETFVDDLKKLILTIENKDSKESKEPKDSVRKGTIGKRKVRKHGSRGQSMDLKKKCGYGFLVVVIVTGLIILILSQIHKLKV